tara:strand:+ start:153 stop:1559 length:1407 start_codon:yes stop_codon:yes gene_type:complete
MAGKLIAEGLEAAFKGGRKAKKGVYSAGKVSQQALDGSVGGAKDWRSIAEEMKRTHQISDYEYRATLANPQHRPIPFAEQRRPTYDGIPKEQGVEFANALARKPGEFRPATLSLHEGISGIHNPLHRVIVNEDEALAALSQAQQGIGEKIAYHKAMYDKLKKLRGKGGADMQPFPRQDGSFSSKKGRALRERYDSEIKRHERAYIDLETTAPEVIVAEWLEDMAKPGFGTAAGKPGGKPIGQTRGMDITEIIQQHHGIPNSEARDMFKQTAFVNEVFKINVWQYIAKQYKVGLGKARASMWNIPKDIHVGKGTGLHAWLTELGFDDYWAKLLDQNPNMSQQEIMNAIDKYFDDVFYPSLIKVETMVMNAPKKKWSNLHLPKEALKQGKQRLAQLLDEVDTWQPRDPYGGFDPESTTGQVKYDEYIGDLTRGDPYALQGAIPPPEPGVARQVLTENIAATEAGKTFGGL